MRAIPIMIVSVLCLTAPLSAQWIQATSYGVLCNGSHDDASDLQAAINQAQLQVANTYFAGGAVLLPSGICILGSGISISQPIALLGVGKMSTTLKPTSGFTGNVISVNLPSSPTFPPSTYVAELAEFSIDLAGNYSATAISLQNVTYAGVVRDLFIRGGNYGLNIGGGSGLTTMNRIRTVTFQDQATASIFINGDTGEEINIDDCNIDHYDVNRTQLSGIEISRSNSNDTGGIYITNTRINNQHSGQQMNYGIYAHAPSGDSPGIYLHVFGSVIDSISVAAIYLTNVNSVYVRNSWIQGTPLGANNGVGVWIQHNNSICCTSGIAFDNNDLRSTGPSVVEFTSNEIGQPSDVEFANNRFCCNINANNTTMFSIDNYTSYSPSALILKNEHPQANQFSAMGIIPSAQSTTFWAAVINAINGTFSCTHGFASLIISQGIITGTTCLP